VQRFIMDMDWKFSGAWVLGVTALCLGITLLSGLLGTWRALRQKPPPHFRNQ
jgi:predicted lysophospholipase L1 biosynthesis ABC-type transport system permease subunit